MMTQPEADIIAKELYGPRAFARPNERTSKPEINVDESWTTGKKLHRVWLSLGWGATWEEALKLAVIRAKWTLRTSNA